MIFFLNSIWKSLRDTLDHAQGAGRDFGFGTGVRQFGYGTQPVQKTHIYTSRGKTDGFLIVEKEVMVPLP